MKYFTRFILLTLALSFLLTSCYSSRLDDIERQISQMQESFEAQNSSLEEELSCQRVELWLMSFLYPKHVIFYVNRECVDPSDIFARHYSLYEKDYPTIAARMAEQGFKPIEAQRIWKKVLHQDVFLLDFHLSDFSGATRLSPVEGGGNVLGTPPEHLKDIKRYFENKLMHSGAQVVFPAANEKPTVQMSIAIHWPENFPDNACYINHFTVKGVYRGKEFDFYYMPSGKLDADCKKYAQDFFGELFEYLELRIK